MHLFSEYTNQELKKLFTHFIDDCNTKLQLISLEIKQGIHPISGATYLTLVSFLKGGYRFHGGMVICGKLN